MAAWDTKREGVTDLTGLVHHADHGSNYLSIVYTDRIGELGAKPTTGTIGAASAIPSPQLSTVSTRPS